MSLAINLRIRFHRNREINLHTFNLEQSSAVQPPRTADLP